MTQIKYNGENSQTDLIVHSLKQCHSFGFNAHCNQFLKLDCESMLPTLLNDLGSEPIVFLGEGSNCIFVDDYQGSIVKIELKEKSVSKRNNSTLVRVGAGENWHEFVTWCLGQQFYGLENLALIPGTVGAAPIQNIGAYGVEVEKFIESVEVFDLDLKQSRTIGHGECDFGYRTSVFKTTLTGRVVVTAVNFCFPEKWHSVTSYGELKALESPSPKAIFNEVVKIRQKKLPDPKDVGNAGSFFKNPVIDLVCFHNIQKNHPEVPHFPVNDTHVKIPAAWLIDKANFKGQTRGGIQCHPNHALVLTNFNNGTGQELLDFAREIVDTINTQFNVALENEVRLIGRHGLVTL
ncbi:UDP-N-acetylmuramate dehydrogenase [Alteromonas sp. 5E99-2]|uniref:UDP-N-acetylmuramate dehydrogenase n=1 Tax=Alteromonas sp. 5E99-2 TaxID=2817683 RepID=UPI00325B2CA0